ncbi:hypothetical protein DPX16_2327 [Anabarilius grahami]|uniref:Uncharacterized protein n=1 Tax=Anabarilius grahami TaxID=495550 RepID=A0A3N0Z3D3_ANAGA|nr:hypothetical protein DPX16_2327 [Anabarilius grahami]
MYLFQFHPVEDRIHHAGMDGLLRNCATGCRVDEAFTMDDLVDSISADTSGLRCGHVQLRIVFITPRAPSVRYREQKPVPLPSRRETNESEASSMGNTHSAHQQFTQELSSDKERTSHVCYQVSNIYDTDVHTA